MAALFLISFLSLPLVRLVPGYGSFFKGLPELWWWIENAVRPLIPVAAGLLLLYGPHPKRWAGELGLDRPIVPALVLAVVLTLPMTILPLAFGVLPNLHLTFVDQLFGAGIWPLAEEVNFRGFAFGQICAYSGLGFWPAGLLTSALFGLGHMARAAAAGLDLAGQLANAGIVGASALGLAWLYFRWGRNLWLVFFLHAIGNLGAALYMSGDVAVGDSLYISLLVATAVLAIVVTLLRDRFAWSERLFRREAVELETAPGEIVVTRASVGDAEALSALALRSKSHWGYPESWLEEWRPQLTISGETIASSPVFVARAGEAILGFYALEVRGATAALDHLWIDPPAIGRGVGRLLFEHARAEAASHGCSLLEIDSDPNAEPFYEAMGAVRVGTIPAPVAGQARELPRLHFDLSGASAGGAVGAICAGLAALIVH